MKNKNQWVTRFKSLDPNNQLQIAEAIIEELNLNEDSLDNDEYDKNKSQLLKCLFDEYIKKASNKVGLLQLQASLNRFNSLSDMDKQAFISKVYDNLINYCNEIDKRKILERKKQERKAKKELCKTNGHDFGEWVEKRWTTLEKYGPSGINALYTGVDTVEVEHVKWTRKCKCCGFVQTTGKKPDEIEANEIKEEIKTLERKLDNINKNK